MKASDVKKAAVIGAGVMGHSIAQVYAAAGIDVSLVDRNEEALKRARDLMEMNLNTLADFNRIPKGDVPKILKRIVTTTDSAAAVRGVDVVVEAVNEVLDLKAKILTAVSEECPEDAVIASNTSGLDIFSIPGIKNPSRLVIHHWFAPPHIIPLVEIVPGASTSKETVAFSVDLIRRFGKVPVELKQFVPSFIVNRIQSYIAMAFYEILEKGWADAEAIDLAVKASLGVRLPIVGVVQSQDFTGLDLVMDVQKSYGVCYNCVDSKVARGHLGAKTGKGFYDYGGRTEQEILRKRDERYLKLDDFLGEIKAYESI